MPYRKCQDISPFFCQDLVRIVRIFGTAMEVDTLREKLEKFVSHSFVSYR